MDLQKFEDPAHLRDDAIIAEDLAIGHADGNVGRRSSSLPDGYNRRRETCMATLFARIAVGHGVSADLVREHRLHRNRRADAAVIGSFALMYVCIAYVITGRIARRFEGEILVAAGAVIAASFVIAWGGMMLGEVWSILMEAVRLGRGHLSYRTERIPWIQHRFVAFVGGVILFWLIAALHVGLVRARR